MNLPIKNIMSKLTVHPYIKGEWKTGKVTVHVTKYMSEIEIDVKESLKHVNHSPTGFSWGYAGSGPAQLALSILLILCSQKDALRLYQGFKSDVIAVLPHEDFELSFKTIERWVASHE